MTLFKKSFFPLLALFLLLAAPCPAAPDDNAARILVLPFTVSADRDLGYLQEGLMDILSARLSLPGRTMVLPRGLARQALGAKKPDAEAARELALRYGADYVLWGKITALGRDTNIDMYFAAASGGREPMAKNISVQGLDGVIPLVNAFADQVKATHFGAAAPPAPALQARPAGQETPLHLLHPEKLLGQGGEAIIGADDPDFFQSPFLPAAIVGLAVADISGNGVNEIAYASKNEVRVLRLEDGQLREIAAFSMGPVDNFLALEAFDLNNNGRAELFITNRTLDRTHSLVLEWQDGGLKPVLRDTTWNFRIINLGGQPTLIGQDSGGDPFWGPIRVMEFAAGKYQLGKEVALPRRAGANALNFNFLRLRGGGQAIAVMGGDDTLTLLDQAGKTLWQSSEKFGGSIVGAPLVGAHGGGDEASEAWYWIPPRLLAIDQDGDGADELVTVKAAWSRLDRTLPGVRTLKPGAVFSLSYQAGVLAENWRSPALNGYPVDYRWARLDGRQVLVMAVVYASGDLPLTQARSVILAYGPASLAAPLADKAKKDE